MNDFELTVPNLYHLVVIGIFFFSESEFTQLLLLLSQLPGYGRY